MCVIAADGRLCVIAADGRLCVIAADGRLCVIAADGRLCRDGASGGVRHDVPWSRAAVDWTLGLHAARSGPLCGTRHVRRHRWAHRYEPPVMKRETSL